MIKIILIIKEMVFIFNLFPEKILEELYGYLPIGKRVMLKSIMDNEPMTTQRKTDVNQLRDFAFGYVKDKIKIDLDFGHIRRKIDLEKEKSQLPYQFNMRGKTFVIEKYVASGGEGKIYEGYFVEPNRKGPVIFSVKPHTKIPEHIRDYFSKEYITFDTTTGSTITIMEKLYPLVFSNEVFEDSMKFLMDLDKYQLKHTDLSASNIMMDKNGKIKFIDYSPVGLGTHGYSTDPKISLGITLLENKNLETIKEILKNMTLDIGIYIQDLPEPKRKMSILILGYERRLINSYRDVTIVPIALLSRLDNVRKTHTMFKYVHNLLKTYTIDPHIFAEIEAVEPQDPEVYDLILNKGYEIGIHTYTRSDDFMKWLWDKLPHDEQNIKLINMIDPNIMQEL